MKSPAGKEEETQGVASNSNQKHSHIEGHEGQHDQISQPNPDSVHRGLNQPGRKIVRTGLDESAMGEPLDQNRHHKDKEQGQDVHGCVIPRPTVEQNLGVLSPEEGHVHHHLMSHAPEGAIHG